MNFSGKFGSDQTIWYPASGNLFHNDGSLDLVGFGGYCWSASPRDIGAYYLFFRHDGGVNPSGGYYRAYGRSVRCLQESK